MKEKKYPWDGKKIKFKNGSYIAVADEGELQGLNIPLENDQKAFKRMVKSERRKLKKLKHAGVEKEYWR